MDYYHVYHSLFVTNYIMKLSQFLYWVNDSLFTSRINIDFVGSPDSTTMITLDYQPFVLCYIIKFL